VACCVQQDGLHVDRKSNEYVLVHKYYLEAIWKESEGNLDQRCPGVTTGQAEGLKLGLERKYAKTIKCFFQKREG
jgi:hypothetical protein